MCNYNYYYYCYYYQQQQQQQKGDVSNTLRTLISKALQHTDLKLRE